MRIHVFNLALIATIASLATSELCDQATPPTVRVRATSYGTSGLWNTLLDPSLSIDLDLMSESAPRIRDLVTHTHASWAPQLAVMDSRSFVTARRNSDRTVTSFL